MCEPGQQSFNAMKGSNEYRIDISIENTGTRESELSHYEHYTTAAATAVGFNCRTRRATHRIEPTRNVYQPVNQLIIINNTCLWVLDASYTA